MSYLMRVYMENFRCTPRTTVYARVKDLAYNLHMCNLCRTFEANCTCRFFLFHAQQTVFNKYTKFQTLLHCSSNIIRVFISILRFTAKNIVIRNLNIKMFMFILDDYPFFEMTYCLLAHQFQTSKIICPCPAVMMDKYNMTLTELSSAMEANQPEDWHLMFNSTYCGTASLNCNPNCVEWQLGCCIIRREHPAGFP